MEQKDLEAIAKVIIEKDLYVLSDEIYSELTYKEDHVSIASHSWHAGTYHPDQWIFQGLCHDRLETWLCLRHRARSLEQMMKIHQYAIMCAPTTSQYAAVEALRNGDDDVAMMREAYNQRRRYLVHAFKEMGLECFEPYGAFYAFSRVSKSLA